MCRIKRSVVVGNSVVYCKRTQNNMWFGRGVQFPSMSTVYSMASGTDYGPARAYQKPTLMKNDMKFHLTLYSKSIFSASNS